MKRQQALKTVKVIRHGAAAAPIITDYVRKHEIDLIAIGTHARRGLARFFLVSVAGEVVRSAKCATIGAGCRARA